MSKQTIAVADVNLHKISVVSDTDFLTSGIETAVSTITMTKRAILRTLSSVIESGKIHIPEKTTITLRETTNGFRIDNAFLTSNEISVLDTNFKMYYNGSLCLFGIRDNV